MNPIANPADWTPIEVAYALDASLYSIEQVREELDDDEWRLYCLEVSSKVKGNA